MQAAPVNIKVLLAAGTPIPVAVKVALGHGGVGRFAKKHGFAAPNVSSCINGMQRHSRIRAVLAAELQVESGWLDAELDAYTTDRRLRRAEESGAPAQAG